jgi:class 3 adenylate cyclase
MPRYARNGDVSLAYDVIGEGDRDVLVTFGWVGSFQTAWDNPAHARWVQRLAALGRVIMWDKRGTGLSERVPPDRLPTLEERMDDMRVVLDAAGSERAVVLGISEGAALGATFAATHPDRTTALIILGGFARMLRDDDYEFGATPEEAEVFNERVGSTWGDNAWLLKLWSPSVADDPVAQDMWNRMLVQGGTPMTGIAWLRMVQATDVRHVLPAIGVPTLVLHRADDRIVPIEHGRYLGRHIPGARYVELPGADHLWWTEGDDILEEVESFVTGAPAVAAVADRVLATVMFTDIVNSTTRAAQVGDRRWRDIVEAHDRLVRGRLERYQGREIKTLGDGFLATFDGPGRAIRCAVDVRDAVRTLGLELRAGLHTGECEVSGADISGIAVNIGARVGARAEPGEVLVSQTVKDLVAGSGLGFEERGEHELKGVPGSWRLYSVGGA